MLFAIRNLYRRQNIDPYTETVLSAFYTRTRKLVVYTARGNYVLCVQDNPLENLNLAFDIAEKYLDIPRMLDAEGNIIFR
jgi:hypothetical protein